MVPATKTGKIKQESSLMHSVGIVSMMLIRIFLRMKTLHQLAQNFHFKYIFPGQADHPESRLHDLLVSHISSIADVVSIPTFSLKTLTEL